jgi:hypothetical protein
LFENFSTKGLTPPYHLPNIHPEPNGSVVKHGNTGTVQYGNSTITLFLHAPTTTGYRQVSIKIAFTEVCSS